MLIISTAPIGRATKKSSHVFRRPVYSGIPFCTSVLISEFAAEKIGLFGLEDFLFGLHRLLVEKQDSVDVKTFFLSLPIFGGKTGLCRREDFFFGLHRFWEYLSESIDCPRVPMNRKFGKP